MKNKHFIGETYQKGNTTWTIIDVKYRGLNEYPGWVIRKVKPMEATETNFNMGYITENMFNGNEPSQYVSDDVYLQHKFSWEKVW